MTENIGFDKIYKDYKNLVLKAAHTYTGDLDTAEDIMQDTFLALYRDMSAKGVKDIAEYPNIKSWLYTTAKHRAINHCKKTSRVVSVDAGGSEGIEEPATESLESEYLSEMTEKMRGELHERIFAALMKKNERWHEAIMMICYMDIPVAETARRLHMTENALYVMMHRARNWIQNQFGVEYDELSRF